MYPIHTELPKIVGPRSPSDCKHKLGFRAQGSPGFCGSAAGILHRRRALPPARWDSTSSLPLGQLAVRGCRAPGMHTMVWLVIRWSLGCKLMCMGPSGYEGREVGQGGGCRVTIVIFFFSSNAATCPSLPLVSSSPTSCHHHQRHHHRHYVI